VGPIRVADGLPDDRVLLLSDILPAGWMGAELCDIRPGQVIAVWGAGPVGQLAIVSARLLGADEVIAIDRVPYRLEMARERAGATATIDYATEDVEEALDALTGGRGPDACIDAVGMEAHGHGPASLYDRAKQMAGLESDRPTALRQAIRACRNGGIVSVIGVYGGFIDKFPMGAVMNRSLTIKAGQCHVQRYLAPLLRRIERGELDPSFVITHRLPLEEGPRGYEMFLKKTDGCEKVVLAA
jgi:threonine dehydrogenase-like Zn-dependent dehydrogenase